MKKITFVSLFIISVGNYYFAQSTYKDVAGIFFARCTSCHHEGASEFPLMNYSSVASNLAMINFNLNNNIMPPWAPDTTYTRFQHERLISSAEKNKILNWIADGAAKGDTTLAPAAPLYPPKYQLKGDADLTVSIPTFTSFATANDIYVCFAVPSAMLLDRTIRAFEVVPGNAAIVHHAVITADTTGNYQSNLGGGCYNIPGNLDIGTYAPGTKATVFPGQSPLKCGIRLKAGSKIILQMHYPKGSAGQVDSTKLRLYFYPINEPNVRLIKVATPLQNWQLNIPANTTTSFTAYYPSPAVGLPAPISLFGIFPHSHVICESMHLYALNPGVDTIPLIRIKRWDFHWQDYYNYKKLLKIPAGYRLFAKHIYNNTTSNPENPNNPPVAVYAGTSTFDEMLFDGTMSLAYQTGDELIDIEAIINSDPLLGLGEQNEAPAIKAMVFPNPFSGTVRIKFLPGGGGETQVVFRNMLGQEILQFKPGVLDNVMQEIVWDGRNESGGQVPTGVYFYEIKCGAQSFTGKMMKEN